MEQRENRVIAVKSMEGHGFTDRLTEAGAALTLVGHLWDRGGLWSRYIYIHM